MEPENHISTKKHRFSARTKIISLLVILIALPITLVLMNQVQNLQKDASEGSAEVLADTTKPNIVVIMLDDVNPMDGRFFTPERTPNIYKYIISKGINFTNFYVETTLCCPARVGYMTGQHTHNHGVPDLDGTAFNPKETIATELQKINYRTMLNGKYVNKYTEIPTSQRIPPGWSTWNAFYQDNGKYYSYNIIHKNNTLTYYGSAPSDYSTKVIGQYAVQKLKESPSSRKVYLEYNPYAIHNPHLVEEKYKGDSRCANIKPWDAPNVGEDDVSDKAKFIRDLANSSNSYDIKKQCEMILSVDEWVGKIGTELQRQGRLNNTVFVLTADNGYSFKQHRLPAKTVPYATHVPLYIAWPDGRGTTPRTDNTILSNIDLPVTFCELAGCTLGPFPNGQSRPDGISFASLLRDEPYPWYRDAILESQPVKPDNAAPSTRPAWWAIRTTAQNPLGLWHYIEYATGEKELYDVSGGPCYEWSPGDPGDPCELNNLLSPNSKVAAPANVSEIRQQLATRLSQLKKEKGAAPIPLTNQTLTPTISISGSPTPTPTPGSQSDTQLPSSTSTINIKADSYVRSDQANTNFGRSTTLAAKTQNPNNVTFLKFTLPNLSGKTIEKAVLKLTSTSGQSSGVGSANVISVKSSPNSWTEANLNYSNKPTLGSSVGSKAGAIASGESFEIDITPGLIGKTGGDISFAIESTGSNTNNLQLNSREASSGRPTLIITYR